MEITKEQENKLGNFKEQLASIKRNISDANIELEGILSAKEKESSAFAARLKEHDFYVVKMQNEKLELIDFIKREKVKLDKEILNIKLDREKLSKEIKDIKKEREACIKLNDDALRNVSSLNKEASKLSEDIGALGSNILSLTKKEKELEFNLSVLRSTCSTMQDDIDFYSDKHEEIIKLANSEILEKQKELISIEEKVKEEASKIKIPRENFDNEKAEFEIYKKNITIIYQRTKKAWEKIYPGQNIDNVIKL